MAEDQTNPRREAVERIKQLMAVHGLTVGDLPNSVEPNPKPSLADARAPVLGKTAAKYRDPVSGAIWNGHGLMPVWLRAAVDAGRRREDFQI